LDRRPKKPDACDEKGELLTELTIDKLGTCQVRSGTAYPCTRPAAVKLQGVPYCESCSREQEAYFAIGELTEAEEAEDKSFAVVMNLMKKLKLRRRMVSSHEPDAA
jgi:hypothetical protein